MRIIAGSAKGISIDAPKGMGTRPTTDKTREAIFGALQFFLKEASVLDLFAGSGAMGIEALSRGAKSCVFIDCSASAIQVIKQNILKAKVSGAEVKKQSFETALLSETRQFDFIFLDPPYASGYYEKAMDLILQRNLLSEDGSIICEHDGTLQYERLTEYKKKKYGKTYVSFFKQEQ